VTTTTIEWRHGTLELLEAGGGPDTLVLLHASLGGPRSLLSLLELLAGPDRRVRAAALPGYGTQSPSGQGGGAGAASAETAAALVEALFQGVSGGRRDLFGHSMGGLFALAAARAGVALDALVLYEPVAFGTLDPDDPSDAAADALDHELAEATLADLAAGDVEVGVARFVSAWGEVPWSALPEPARRVLLSQAPRLAADIAFVRGERTPAAAYASLGMPTLVLAGDRPPAAAGRICRRIAAAVPGAIMQTVTGAGHMAPVASPRPIAERVEAFLGSLRPRDRR
jgi:pimeloyl-ACP methyl ester carboxylesterase